MAVILFRGWGLINTGLEFKMLFVDKIGHEPTGCRLGSISDASARTDWRGVNRVNSKVQAKVARFGALARPSAGLRAVGGIPRIGGRGLKRLFGSKMAIFPVLGEKPRFSRG